MLRKTKIHKGEVKLHLQKLQIHISSINTMTACQNQEKF